MAIPPISEATILEWLGEASVRKGRGYTRQVITETHRADSGISGYVQGRATRPYQVTVTFLSDGEIETTCSCPMSIDCKHVAALLFAFLRDPVSFTPTAFRSGLTEADRRLLDTRLAEVSPNRLRAIFKLVASHTPALTWLLRAPVLVADEPPPTITPDQIQQLAIEAFARSGHLANIFATYTRVSDVEADRHADEDEDDEAGEDDDADFDEDADADDYDEDDEYDEYDDYDEFDDELDLPDPNSGPITTLIADLETLLALSESYRAVDHWAGVAAVAQGVGIAVVGNLAVVPNRPAMTTILEHAIAIARSGLEEPSSRAETRELCLRALFEILWADSRGGSQATAPTAQTALLTPTAPAERLMVADWIRDGLAKTIKPGGSAYLNPYFGRFLFDLERDSLSVDALMQGLLETGQRDTYVARMLKLGRAEAAAVGIGDVVDLDLIRYGDQFAAAGQAELIERIAAQRLLARADPLATPIYGGGNHTAALRRWLRDRYAASGNLAGALTLAQQDWREAPSMAGYQALKQVAEPLNQWADLREALIDQLAEQRGHRDLYIDLLLAEQRWEQALAATPPQPIPAHRAYSFLPMELIGVRELSTKVAEAVEATHPHLSIERYQFYAEALAESRVRADYPEAARLLKRMRDLVRRIGSESDWQAYIAGYRARFKILRALQSDLKALGL